MISMSKSGARTDCSYGRKACIHQNPIMIENSSNAYYDDTKEKQQKNTINRFRLFNKKPIREIGWNQQMHILNNGDSC